MTELQHDLPKRIIAFIQSSQGIQANSENNFNQLARDIFAYQFAHNQPYRQFAQQQRQTPLTVKRWQDVPRMPIQAFKKMVLSTENISQAAEVFYSSGTTDPMHKSKHYLSRLDVWEAAMRRGFEQFVIPNRQKMLILSLFPDQTDNPNSSLSRYISGAIKTFGTPDSQILFKNNRLILEDFKRLILGAKESQQPVLIIGASFSYVHLLEALSESASLSCALPTGSIVFDTGGFKGQSKTVDMAALYAQLSACLNVPREQIVNMFGMTEISSQCYDRNLLDKSQNQMVSYDKITPAWVRIQILDSANLQPVALGEPGILAYYDLANWDTCLAILTEDLAVKTRTGFKIIGRATGTEARGCSIAVDGLMRSQENVVRA